MFDAMLERNVLTWTALINGFSAHGRSKEALRLFDEMMKAKLQPEKLDGLFGSIDEEFIEVKRVISS